MSSFAQMEDLLMFLSSLSLFCLSFPKGICFCVSPPKNHHSNQRTVISTEAAYGIIVSSAAEKSAFRPKPSANHNRTH
jgi:hypothetical protein